VLQAKADITSQQGERGKPGELPFYEEIGNSAETVAAGLYFTRVRTTGAFQKLFNGCLKG